jgi:hypothetical protein
MSILTFLLYTSQVEVQKKKKKKKKLDPGKPIKIIQINLQA